MRVALIGLFISLGIGNAWGHSKHYGKATLVNATGNGTVYLSTAADKNSGQSGSSTPGTINGTSYITWNCGEDSDKDSKTYYARGTANNGYYYAGWATTSTATSYTAATTGNSFSASSETESSPTETKIYGFFKPVTIPSVATPSPNHFDATNTATTCLDYTGTVVFTTANADAKADFQTPAITNKSGNGNYTVTTYTYESNKVTVSYKFTGDGTYGGTNRSNSATITLTSAGGENSRTSTAITASYPNAKILSGSAEDIYTTFKTADAIQAGVERTAVFDVELVDGTDNFDTPSITGTGESHFTYNSMSYADGKLTVTYTYNGNKEAGDHTATLTLKLNNAIGGTDATYGSKSVTLIAHNEQESDYDAKIENASGGLVLQGDWASVLAKQANGYKITLLRNVDLGKLAAAQSITTNLTLDLNGKTLSGTVSSSVKMLLYMNKSSRTLTIMDSKTGGKLSATGAYTNALYGVFVNNGNVVLNSGTIEITNTNTSQTTADRLYATGVYVNAGKTFTMNGGTIVSHRAARDAYGVYVHGTAAASGVATINGGTINVTSNTYAYGIRGYGDININGGTINAETLTGGYAYGVHVRAAANATATSGYAGSLTMSNGTINSTSKTGYAYGVYMQTNTVGTAATITPEGTHSNQETGELQITGGTIKAINNGKVEKTHQYAYGIYTDGSYSSKNAKHITQSIKNVNIYAEGSRYIYGIYAAAGAQTNSACNYADVELTDNEIEVFANATVQAYAVYAGAASRTVMTAASADYAGEYASAAKVTINSGTYTARTTTTNAYAVCSATRAKTTFAPDTTLGGNAEAYPEIIIHGGEFFAYSGTTTARAVSSGGNTTIDGGTFTANATTTTAYGIYAVAGKLDISGATVNSEANSTAAGVYVDCAVASITGFCYHADATLKNLTVNVTTRTGNEADGVWMANYKRNLTEATLKSDSTSNKWTAASYAQYKKVYQFGDFATSAKCSIIGGTYTVQAAGTTAYGVRLNGPAISADADGDGEVAYAYGQLDISNATISAKTNGTTTVYGVFTGGPTTITNCNITASSKTTTCCGLFIEAGKTTLTGSTINASGTETVRGIYVSSRLAAVSTTQNVNTEFSGVAGFECIGELEAADNVVTATATGGNTAYGIYVHAVKGNTASGPFAGDHAIAGEAVINGGTYTASASGTTAYAVCVADPVLQGEATATPSLVINGGKFKGTATSTYADVSVAGEPGYFVLNGGYYVKDENLDKKLGEGMNKVAVKSGTPEYTEGYRWRVTDNMTGEYVCKIKENSTSYASLEEALQVVNASPESTWTIIMIANYTLSKGDYVLPANTTLLIPYQSGQTAINGTTPKYTSPSGNVEQYEAPTPLYKLTFSNGVNMSVYGKIEASAVTYLSNQGLTSHGTGVVSGKYGWLYLNEGSHIDLENGAALYAWGYVTGKGEINAKNGSAVYEDFQMGDWRGGTAEMDVNENTNGLDKKGVFLITHYYYQNIECPITYRAGAQGFAHGGTYVYGASGWIEEKAPTKEAVKMIGTSDAMFLMDPATAGEDTWVRKEYDTETDYVNWTMNSGAKLGSVSLKISASGININLSSSDYVLPITSNFNIVANDGEIQITNHVCFIPGSKLTIKKEGTLTIPSGQRVFFYDQDDWKSYSGYWFNPYYSPSWKVNPRVATIGDKTKVKMPDAEVLVEGLLNVNGAIYTTAGGANIHSTRENAGKVKFGATLPAATAAIEEWYGSNKPNQTLCQWVAFKKPAGSDDSKVYFEGKALNPAWLKNEDGTYSKPTSSNTSSGDTWTYMQSLTEDTYEWTLASEDGCFTTRKTGDTKTYVHPSDWVAVSGANANHAYLSEDGTRVFVNTEAASTSASCKWWDVNPTPEVIDAVTYYVANNENFDNFGTYYYWDNTTSYWKPKKITVTWQNEDGTKITNGTYGDLYSFNTSPQFFGTNPKKTPTAIEKYDWIGWRDADGNIYDKNATLPRATSDVTYTAYFNTTKYQYTITFKNDDNSDLWAGLVDAGTTGAELQALFEQKYNEKTGYTVPQKAPTVDKVFTFTGWNTALATVTAAATYTAQYSESPRKYHVTFYNYDAVDELYTVDVNYNTAPTYSGVTPFRANTSAFSYDWTGWQQGTNTYGTTAALPVVTGNISYIATFAQTELQYQVFFKRQDGTIIDAPKFSYEETPSAFPANPTMASTVSTDYTFREWSPATLVPVTEDGMVYTALFDESPRQYTAHFVNFNGVSLNADQTIDYNTVPTYTGADPMKPNDSRNSYEFSGWAWAAGDGWEAGSIGAGEAFPAIKGDITFTAQYNPVLLQFDVIYQREDGTVILRDKKKYGESTAFPTTFDGATSGLNYEDEAYTYTFDHWSPATVVTPVITDATYTAYYNRTLRTYSITAIGVNPAGYGSVSPASLASIPSGSAVTVNGNKITVNGTTIIATPADATAQYTYTFSHWNNVPATVTGNVANIEAVFTRTVNQYEVTFNMKGHGSAISGQTKDYGSKIDKPADPSEAGYTFVGWYKEDACTNAWNFASDEVTGATTLYAKWTVNSYTITFDTDGGSAVASITQDYSSTVTPPANPTRTGYTFAGWLPEVPTTMPIDGATCVAQWSIDTYNISYTLDGGTVTSANPATYNVETATFTLNNPTKEGYTFLGWTGSNGETPQTTVSIAKGSTGDKSYTANWVVNVAAVTVDGETTYYASIAEAWEFVNDQTANTTIKLLQDATTTESLVFTPAAAMTCMLDLNNHTLSGAVNKLININLAGSTFIIDDSSDDKNGKILAEYSVNDRLYAVFLTVGTLNLEAGHIHSKNPHTYSSATANKNSAATGLYVTKGQKFTMDGGTVESESQYNSIAIFASESGTTPITINGGRVYGHTTASTSGIGIYTYAKGLVVNGGTIIGHAYTSTAYGIYVRGGSATLNGGRIEATNDTTSSKGSTTAYGIYARGPITIPATSTVDVYAQARTNTAYAVFVYAGITGNTIAGGTFTAKAKTGKTAGGIYSAGNITVTGGTFTATTKTTGAYGIYSVRGTVTVNGDPTFNATAGSTTAYGAYAYGTIGANGKSKYSGTINIKGGTFNVTSTKETAYGAYAALVGKTVKLVVPENADDTIAGTHYMPGIISITDGTFNVKAKTTAAYGIVVAAAKSESGAVGTTTRIPTATITGGKFKVESAGDDNATAYAMNSSATATNLKVQGGWYNTEKTNASSKPTIGGKYAAPAKDCNYHVLPLTGEDPYMYEVAEAYTITFNNYDGTPLQSSAVKKGATPVYSGETPTKAEDESYTYTFSGWDPEVVEVSEEATYTAQFDAISKETGFYADIVDATATSLTINTNVTGWSLSKWPYTINGTSYGRKEGSGDEQCNADRTITIPHSLAADESLLISISDKNDVEISRHNYVIPHVYEENAVLSGTDENSIVFVHRGKLTVNETQTAKAVYVAPGAELEINGTLTVDKLVLRTSPWSAAILTNNGTLDAEHVYYSRVVADNSQYYQFGLPVGSATTSVVLSDGNAPAETSWILKEYSESARAINGISDSGANWKSLISSTIDGGKGYELFSASAYYREYYFPVNLDELTNSVAVQYTPSENPANSGWNMVTSPLTSVYENDPVPEGITISILNPDGNYTQENPSVIYPAVPFAYQAAATGTLSFEASSMAFLSQAAPAPRRAKIATEEPTRIQWIHVDLKDANGVGDQTSIYAHPTRYDDTYKTGIDVSKQSLTASRAIIYSSHAYGEMAFAGVSDSLLARGIAMTVYSPRAQELTFSMRENNWLNRLAAVWLIDNETGYRTDLLWSTYTFDAPEGTTAGRFTIAGEFYAPQIATGMEGTSARDNKARKVLIDQKMYILVNGRVFDATGKMVTE